MVPFPLKLERVKAVIFDLDNTLVSSDMNFKDLRQQLGCPQNEDLLDFVDKLDHPHQREHAHNVIFDHEISDAVQSSPMLKIIDIFFQLTVTVSVTRNNHEDTVNITEIINNQRRPRSGRKILLNITHFLPKFVPNLR